MNWFERWMLRRIIRKAIVHGPWWDGNVTEIFQEIDTRYRRVFNEDNYYTRVANLQECFDKAVRVDHYEKNQNNG